MCGVGGDEAVLRRDRDAFPAQLGIEPARQNRYLTLFRNGCERNGSEQALVPDELVRVTRALQNFLEDRRGHEHRALRGKRSTQQRDGRAMAVEKMVDPD